MGNTTHTFLLLALLLTASASVQPADLSAVRQPTHSISLEMAGPNIVGLSFDSRLRGHSGLGYRVGIGYNVCRDWNDFNLAIGNQMFRSSYDTNCNGFGIPLEVNYLLGRRKHLFEAALGASLGFHKGRHCEWNSITVWEEVTGEEGTQMVEQGYESTSSNVNVKRFGYMLFLRAGYRLQPLRGVDFRLGLMVGRQMCSHVPYHGAGFMMIPYLSIGYSF